MKFLPAFDLDGTLVDLQVDWGWVKEEVERLVDKEISSLWDLAVPPLLYDYLRKKKAIDQVFETAEAQADYRLLPLSELVSQLEFCIVSNNTRATIQRIVEENSWKVRGIVGRDDVGIPKPSGEGLRKVSASVYVGDHPFDMEAALRAGIPFLLAVQEPNYLRRFLDHLAGIQYIQ